LVSITSSSNPEIGKLEDTISWEPQKCNLVTKPNNYIIIDFKDYSICCKKYTLRHTLSRDTEALRNWKFSGSNDNINWIDLKVHVNDASLTLKGTSKSWDIDSNSNSYFRYFRILQNGFNSSNNDYFSLGGVEMYGTIKKI